MRHLFSRLCMVLAIVVSLLIVQAGAALATKGPAVPESGPSPGHADESADPQRKSPGRDPWGRFK